MSETPCEHNVVFGGVCTTCQQRVDTTGYVMSGDGLYVSKSAAEEQSRRDDSQLVSSERLSLIVDLDQTLIDTYVLKRPGEMDAVIQQDKEHESDFLEFSRYLVRIRPNIHEFLERIMPMYQLSLFTLAERTYATKIMEKIDPDGKYFQGRYRCRDDTGSDTLDSMRKTTTALFPCSDKLVLVLDDTPDVWQNSDGLLFAGLLQIERFEYFFGRSSTVNQAAVNDVALIKMANVLTKVHASFYDDGPDHVLISMSFVRKSVLAGCYIMFDGLWREGDSVGKRFYFKKAEDFGGIPVLNFTPYCTHIVIRDSNASSIAKAADYKGIHIVTEGWFRSSWLNYEKADESNTMYHFPGVASPTTGEQERSEPPEFSETSDCQLEELFNTDSEEEEESGDTE